MQYGITKLAKHPKPFVRKGKPPTGSFLAWFHIIKEESFAGFVGFVTKDNR